MTWSWRSALCLTAVLCVITPLDAQQPTPQSTQQDSAGKRQPAPQKRRGDRNKLTRIDLEEAGATMTTARDAVRMLRPHWLQPPLGRMASSNVSGAGGGAKEVVVYVDGMRQPDLESLVMIPAAKIVEMRYLDQNRSIALHGPGHEAGVIEVTTTDKRK